MIPTIDITKTAIDGSMKGIFITKKEQNKCEKIFKELKVPIIC